MAKYTMPKAHGYNNMTNNRYLILFLLAGLILALPLNADVKRESRHFLTAEAGLGYSALLNSSDLGSSSGLAGAKLQVGYEWRYRKLLVHTGLELASVNDLARVTPFQKKISYTVGLPDGQYMTEYFDFRDYTETQMMGQLAVPVELGGVFDDRYYFLAGVNVGFPFLRSAVTHAQVHTWLEDPSLIGRLDNVPAHDAYTTSERAASSWRGFVNAQLSAEVGLILNPFFEKPQKGKGRGASASGRNRQSKKKPVLYRVALFADYGINSCVIKDNALGQSGQPLVTVAEPRTIRFDNILTSSEHGAHSLLVGAKFAVLFQLNEQKPDKPLPSYFDIWIADAVTHEPVPAGLTIYDMQKKRSVLREAKKGHLRYRVKDGSYTITASNEQYYPASLEASMQGDGVTDTLLIALERKPQPVVIDTPVIDIPIKVGTKVVLHNLFFATGKTQILPESEAALDELSAFMNAHPALTIRITGHTDNVGSDQANQLLSEGRAGAVRDELVKRGVQPDCIEAEGKGESEPIADNSTEEGRSRNRRVEITILSTGGALIEQVRE